MSTEGRCGAQWRHKISHYSEPHSGQCQKPEGHDGGHEWKRDARTVIWFGDSKPPDITRLRFGKWIEQR